MSPLLSAGELPTTSLTTSRLQGSSPTPARSFSPRKCNDELGFTCPLEPVLPMQRVPTAPTHFAALSISLSSCELCELSPHNTRYSAIISLPVSRLCFVFLCVRGGGLWQVQYVRATLVGCHVDMRYSLRAALLCPSRPFWRRWSCTLFSYQCEVDSRPSKDATIEGTPLSL